MYPKQVKNNRSTRENPLRSRTKTNYSQLSHSDHFSRKRPPPVSDHFLRFLFPVSYHPAWSLKKTMEETSARGSVFLALTKGADRL